MPKIIAFLGYTPHIRPESFERWFETVRRIRHFESHAGRERAARVIALTANASDADLRQCMDAGMNEFLAKPLSLQALGRTLDGWRERAVR